MPCARREVLERAHLVAQPLARVARVVARLDVGQTGRLQLERGLDAEAGHFGLILRIGGDGRVELAGGRRRVGLQPPPLLLYGLHHIGELLQLRGLP
eukprot:6549926-Alexandrium_andersonii.AAC.1